MIPVRIVFMGTPDFAVPALQALFDAHYDVVAVYTRAPKPKGRGHQVQKSPVHLLAEQKGIPVYTPKTLRVEEAQAVFAALKPDLAIVAAYGLILPVSVLEAPRYGCLNIHGSLLPRWRGAAPVSRAILAGDQESGVCLMKMEEGLDTGPVYASHRLPITSVMTAQNLMTALSLEGAKLLIEKLALIISGECQAVAQPEEGVTYAAKLEKHESALDWSLPAATLARQVRAFTPWPAATFVFQGDVIKVLSADVVTLDHQSDVRHQVGTILDANMMIQCGDAADQTSGCSIALHLKTLQRPGKGPVTGAEFLRGLRLKAGDTLVESFP